MISIYRWDTAHNHGEWVKPELLVERGAALLNSKDIFWIDLESPTEDEEQLVFRQFLPIHSLSLEDVTFPKRLPDAPPHFPKVEEFPDYLFVIANPLRNPLIEDVSALSKENRTVFFGGSSSVNQLSAVLTERVLITHHYEPAHCITEMRAHVEKHHACAQRGPDYLFHLILDEMVDEYAPVLDHLGDALEDYEVRLFKKPTRTMLTRLIHCKRSIIVLRKTLIYEREVLARMSRGDFDLIDDREAAYYRNVYDHLIRFTELIEASREMVSDLLQMHLASSSHRLNEIMKMLAVISTIILPMTLVAGIYGMNFENMKLIPPAEADGGHVFTYAVMLLAGLLPLAFFKWRKWI